MTPKETGKWIYDYLGWKEKQDLIKRLPPNLRPPPNK